MPTDETTVSRSAQVFDRVKQAAALVVLLGFLFLPLWLGVAAYLSGEPLWATRTVEVTRPYGVIPETAPLVLAWALILLCAWVANVYGPVRL
jgi:hypothetical protein